MHLCAKLRSMRYQLRTPLATKAGERYISGQRPASEASVYLPTMPKSCAPVKVLANYSTHARPREILHKLGVLNELSSDQNPCLFSPNALRLYHPKPVVVPSLTAREHWNMYCKLSNKGKEDVFQCRANL